LGGVNLATDAEEALVEKDETLVVPLGVKFGLGIAISVPSHLGCYLRMADHPF
jgi:hypothetical protein